jgi:gentisate 1,2-dioxygenase
MDQPAQKDSIASLDHDMAGKNLSGYWRLGMEGLPNHPLTSVQPCLWKWQDVYDSLIRAGDVISLENSERRVVRLVNPGLDQRHAFATHTIQVSFQFVKPGENARAHRHTPAALRFVIQGNGAYTTVNGQQCVMEPGDLILTPTLTWHDHSTTVMPQSFGLMGWISPWLRHCIKLCRSATQSGASRSSRAAKTWRAALAVRSVPICR